MTMQILITETTQALAAYRQAITRVDDAQEKEDCLRLAAITDKLIAAMQSDDVAEVKLGVLSFSRQVSDSFAVQPPEFKVLANKIHKIKQQLI